MIEADEGRERQRPPEHEPDEALRALADLLREIGQLDERALRASMADLTPGARTALANAIGISIRRLRKVADAT